MAATVTIDKSYFETLLRRAEFHTSGRDLTTPVNIPVVSIPKVDHDNLLRIAQEYARLKQALFDGGIEPETLEILIRGGSIVPMNSFGDQEHPGDGGVSLFARPQKTQVTMSRPPDGFGAESTPNWPSKSAGNGPYHQGYTKGKTPSFSRNNSSAQEDDISWDPEIDKDDQGLTIPRVERKRYARDEQRTIVAKNLSDRTTHKDIVDFVRGGPVLDIYLRSNERSASISFVEGSAAQEFMNHVKRNDVYIHGKRLEFSWNDRQFVLPGHVANKIGIGATRNLVIRNVHSNITEERLREDLDHIHNLVIIDIYSSNGDCHLSLNSIHNSLFARTCMMSRAAYKGMRIEWYPDECAQPLPKVQYITKKENLAPPPAKKANAMMNRFQMLNMDDNDTEEGSEEGELLSELSSLNINHRSPWNPGPVAA